MLFVTRSAFFAAATSGLGAPAAGGRRSRSLTEAAMIDKPWTATSMLVAAPTVPLLLAVTVNSRPGPGLGLGRGGRRPRRCSRNDLRGASAGRTG